MTEESDGWSMTCKNKKAQKFLKMNFMTSKEGSLQEDEGPMIST